MTLIVHCTRRSAWNDAVAQGAYVAPSLQEQGFIHFSAVEQVLPVADALFRGQSGLVLLCVDSRRLLPELRYENLEGGTEQYPHVYGPVNLDAVIEVADFPPEADGTFRLPADLFAFCLRIAASNG